MWELELPILAYPTLADKVCEHPFRDRKSSKSMNPNKAEPPQGSSDDSDKKIPVRRASLMQVAKVMSFGLLMIGKKGSWEKGGYAAQVTPGQVVVGGIVGGIVLVVVLITIVRVVLRLATV